MKSTFILNGKLIKINKIKYEDGSFIICGKNPNCFLNIDLKTNLDSLEINIKKDISKEIYHDQNFYTDNYSYVIGIENIFITKISNKKYLLELNIPNVEILVPPYDNINKKRVELDNKKIEVKSIELNAYFNI